MTDQAMAQQFGAMLVLGADWLAGKWLQRIRGK